MFYLLTYLDKRQRIWHVCIVAPGCSARLRWPRLGSWWSDSPSSWQHDGHQLRDVIADVVTRVRW